jgi:hypothetical protein
VSVEAVGLAGLTVAPVVGPAAVLVGVSAGSSVAACRLAGSVPAEYGVEERPSVGTLPPRPPSEPDLRHV